MLLGLAAVATMQAYGPVCLRDGDSVSGEFRYVESRHPNGTNLRYGFVKTVDPVCVLGEAGATGEPYVVQGRWVQISWSDEMIGDRPFPGDQVEIAADCFEPMTAWHLGDIICINARLISREPM
ncbi:hypothetical protein [Brevundimonas basaltis]|uniref:Uncharacterized protein n=1 Tax=Brevundimonas basaltis TaxID=472166 RepID=A0A7W8MGP0_9CAUL|nr:hypothetical protein [Brevundimonas basaltis]MBB5291372.1 hypothetical protein [Brevundimonas basaltis]